MKNLVYRALALVCVLATTISFTACQSDDASVGSAVQLYAFGPTPVMRGGEISFLGENLDKVTEIILPENITVEDITVESSKKITITIPQEATVGYVTLNYKGGSITTKTMMGYTEPYEITSISPTNKSVRAGDEITIDGDYLNNITAVVFGGDAKVEAADFTEQGRYQITLALPAEATSGKLYVEDANGNQLYSDGELTVLQPTISSITPLTIKAGNELTINGKNLDLVASIEFGGAQVATEFKSQSESKIVVATPAAMADGTITLTSRAGQTVASTDALECIVPTNLATAAADGYKAGNTLTISGDDLDLVTVVQFAGSAAVSEFTPGTSISVVIPADAIEGVITLTTAAAKDVETPAITLIKPVVSSLESIDIISGEDITAHGKDFDLVTSVTLSGEELEFEYDAESGDITVHTLISSLSGDVKFITANGTSVHAATMTITPDLLITTTTMPETAMPGDEITIEGAQFNKIESIMIGSVKVTDYISRSDSSITFIIPEVETDKYKLTYKLTTGESEETIGSIAIGQLIATVELWSGSLDLGGWGSSQGLAWDGKPAALADMPYGATINFDFTPTATGTQFKICDPEGWVPFPDTTTLPGYNAAYGVVDVPEGVTTFSFKLSDATVDAMRTRGIIIAGKLCIVTRVYYTYDL